jgi:outer membrane protein OmpA-like peptidoglycan-associated protein
MACQFSKQAFIFILGALFSVILPSVAFCQEDADVAKTDQGAHESGCIELSMLRRIGTSSILSCDSQSSAEVTIPLQPNADGYARQKVVRGPYEFREYHISSDLLDMAFENILQLLPVSEFTVKYSSNPSTISARKDNIWVLINVNGETYTVTAVTDQEKPWQPVSDAEGIAHEMAKNSHVAIYGIEFTADNQTIVEEHSTILTEVLKYLAGNPALNITVESHTESRGGTAETDLIVTEKRSKAVAAWLEAHRIPAGRLHTKGSGRTNPLTENDTPLEIQQNERIELVKASS